MDVYIVRHGSTKSNHESKYYGSYESCISKQGYEEIKKVKTYLAPYSFDYVFCSDRKRALQTAERVIENVPITVDSRLCERKFGIFENKTYETIRTEFYEEVQEWEKDWKGYRIPEGESFLQCYERTKDFMKGLEVLDAENVLIVTHGGIIRNMLCYVLDDQQDLFWKFAPKNGDVVLLKYEYEHWYIDQIRHVGQEN